MSFDLIAGRAYQVSVKAPNQSLTYIGMKLRLEQGSMRILAGKDPFFEDTLIHQVFQIFGDVLEVLAHLIFHAALGMAAFVSSKSIAASSTCQRMEQVFPLREFAQPQIKDARPMSV